mmetsp:Transcript_32890/g.99517  ORF Transcript_32890/g.99517 Transcript_32890/m.99517 type:complete len:311 (+) Transcript_32890:218-1150(+)
MASQRLGGVRLRVLAAMAAIWAFPHTDGRTVPLGPTGAGRRTVIVGDVHGCLDELHRLLGPDGVDLQGDDHVVLVGDLINKGPWPLEVLRTARRRGWEVVLGNHEAALQRLLERLKRMEHEPRTALLLTAERDPARIGPQLQYRLRVLCQSTEARAHRAMCRPPLQAMLHAMTGNDLEWLASLPTTIRLPLSSATDGTVVVVVHGGADPSVPLTAQHRDVLLSLRNILPNGEPALEKNYNPSDGAPWASLWPGPEHIVFGHDARRRLQQWQHATGLDTGCVYGGNLTALVLPGWQLQSVPCPTYQGVPLR